MTYTKAKCKSLVIFYVFHLILNLHSMPSSHVQRSIINRSQTPTGYFHKKVSDKWTVYCSCRSDFHLSIYVFLIIKSLVFIPWHNIFSNNNRCNEGLCCFHTVLATRNTTEWKELVHNNTITSSDIQILCTPDWEDL